MEFCPAILTTSESEFRDKVEKVRRLGLPLHVDVMDGVFVPETTWADPVQVMRIADDLPVEAHLMTADPEHGAMVWLAAGARRVWIHAESTGREMMITRSLPDDQVAKIGLVINPETPISRVVPDLDRIGAVMLMGVTPGRSGQKLQEITFDKIASLKEIRPHLWVKVDGGVNEGNVARLAEAGADSVAAASSLTDSPDPESALNVMTALVQNAVKE